MRLLAALEPKSDRLSSTSFRLFVYGINFCSQAGGSKKFLPQEPSYASKVTPDRLGEPLNSHLNTHRRSRAP